MNRRAILLIGLLAAGCRREADPAAAGRLFFEQVAASRFDAAFRGAAFFFQKEQSAREFEVNAGEMGLPGSKIIRAESPTMKGVAAKWSIVVQAPDGAEMPLVVMLIRERGAWRIFSIRSPRNMETGLSENRFTRIGKNLDAISALDRPVPDERTIRAMTTETMLQFSDAIQQKSFEDFYEITARAWQRQLTLGMLTRTFQGFIDRRTNLASIQGLEAMLNHPPRIDSEGLLVVSGSYPAQPYRVAFALKFYYEMPNWRVFGMDVSLHK